VRATTTSGHEETTILGLSEDHAGPDLAALVNDSHRETNPTHDYGSA